MEGKFEISLDDNILKITMKGGLDATNAPELSDKLKDMIGRNAEEIVFFAAELAYIASAGLRVIVFAIQKILKPGGKAYFIGGQKDVLSVISMTGLDDSLLIQETYEE
jgi:anti-anti-sigma factor